MPHRFIQRYTIYSQTQNNVSENSKAPNFLTEFFLMIFMN